jgi:hypothetical protein
MNVAFIDDETIHITFFSKPPASDTNMSTDAQPSVGILNLRQSGAEFKTPMFIHESQPRQTRS